MRWLRTRWLPLRWLGRASARPGTSPGTSRGASRDTSRGARRGASWGVRRSARTGVPTDAGARAAGALALVLVLFAGCSFQARQLPLPGGPDTGAAPYRVTAEFADVLDLVPRSVVKVADVTVGEVESVELDGYTARVTMRLRDSVRLPDNATARIRQTSLLGEKFVSLDEPTAERARGRLGEGDLIRLDNTGRNVEVEEVLSALSALLNGGGIAQLKSIQVELNKALDGRESDVSDLLRRLERVLGQLDDRKREITDAIERLDALAAELRGQRRTIGRAVDELPAAVEILADQRKDLTTLLEELSELGDVGTRVINSTQQDLVANLEALDPVLTELAAAGDSLPKSLQLLFTYPFPDSAADGIQGDFANIQITLDADLQALLSGEGPLPIPGPDDSDDSDDSDRSDESDGNNGDSGDGGDSGDSGDGKKPRDDGSDDGDPSPPPDEDDGGLPCLPLLCRDSGADGSVRSAAGASDGGYDPELARLLLGGVR